ncbi:hypothetical protein AMATHDRAFT_54369 [Amanita thiersii Skay4041]|uniref:Uncharacterized protein n=1 Tax=Amanita thiersii Skay4041 TaxID=703135 RepID=A0A2A9NWM1_9AGAR|nr:hypothetical protein AMATHDRAFT_54369 [Amanita thiersii Skay4041]
MSNTSYRLENARPRHIPAPLHLESSSYYSRNRQSDPQPLLYDLPSAATLSPPTSPRSKLGHESPTSSSFTGRSRTAQNVGSAASPSRRNRSLTPLGVAPNELEKFAENCRAWYFNQDDNAGRKMTQTLATLPSSQRAPFSRVQASIRAAYHRSVNARKTAEFRAHLAATQPGGSLMPHARANSAGSAARKERYERMDHFIRTWCTVGMPGTKPFFESLWAIMRLQVVPEKLGGAGRKRIEWEFDDAVFKESAGKDFMLEAVDVLKGVLAFEDVPSSRIASTIPESRLSGANTTHSRSQSQPLPSDQKPTPIPPLSKRARAPSDPFLDAPNIPQPIATPSSPSTNTAVLTANSGPLGQVIQSPFSIPNDTVKISQGSISLDDTEEEEDDFLRIWTSPDLSNPEILDLLKLFPPFITRRPLPRFPPAPRHTDIEEGYDGGPEGRQVHFGTGSFWVSSKERGEGWDGGWWGRFVAWWRSTFC